MNEERQPTMNDIAQKTGLKVWKVGIVLGEGDNRVNLHRVTDDEMAVILHAAAELGYQKVLKGAKKKAVTLPMLAKRAGVGVSTAYNALQDRELGVTKETKDHVRRIAAELGYKNTRKTKLKDFYARNA